MAFGRRMQPIDGVGGAGDGRIESERPKRAFEIVVDRFGNADDRDSVLMELLCDAERTIAADRHHRRQPQLCHSAFDIFKQLGRQAATFAVTYFGGELPAVGRAQNGSAADQQAVQSVVVEDAIVAAAAASHRIRRGCQWFPNHAVRPPWPRSESPH